MIILWVLLWLGIAFFLGIGTSLAEDALKDKNYSLGVRLGAATLLFFAWPACVAFALFLLALIGLGKIK
jgi:hypothetical protein